MEVALFRQRLAEQEAHGVRLLLPRPTGRGTAGAANDPAESWQGQPADGELHEEVGAGGARAGLSSPPQPPRLPSLVEDLLPKPRLGGLLRFKTLYSVSEAIVVCGPCLFLCTGGWLSWGELRWEVWLASWDIVEFVLSRVRFLNIGWVRCHGERLTH